MANLGLGLFDPAFVGMSRGISSPEDITNLYTWLDAADGPLDAADAAITADGTACKTWTDLEGNFTVTNGGASSTYPTWKENIINGFPVLRFDGAGDILGNAGAGNIAQPMTAFLVARFNSVGVSTVSLIDGETSRRWGFQRASLTVEGASVISFVNSGTDVFMGYSSGPTDWMILARVWSTTDAKIAFNSNVMTSVGAVGSNAWRGLYLGNNAAASASADCDIAEFILYNAEKSDSECASVINYLSGKYDIDLDGNDGWGVIGTDDFESYTADDAVDGLTGGTGFNGSWEGH